jgi:hypothetical protein
LPDLVDLDGRFGIACVALIVRLGIILINGR